MSPTYWGPPTWNLLHTLAEECTDTPEFVGDVFQKIKMITKHLPCPDCSNHAGQFWKNINESKIKTKEDLKSVVFILHNEVNSRKKQPGIQYSSLVDIYGNNTLSVVFNKFVSVYQTRDAKLITENFHRQRLVTLLRNWLTANYTKFNRVYV